jgi:hypothetical protein
MERAVLVFSYGPFFTAARAAGIPSAALDGL